MIKKYLSLFLLTGLLFGLGGQVASAHVLLVDEQANIASVFHSNPNDDPIAGESAELFFDIQDKNSQTRIPYNAYDLFITNDADVTTKVATQASGSTVIAEYTFPARGFYSVSLRSKPNFDQFQKVMLNGSIRINRGIGASAQTNTYGWATTAMIVSLTVVVLLGILFVNNRGKILDNSRF